MLLDDHLCISSFISGAVYIFKSLEIQFNTCQLQKSACVILLSPFISYGSSPDMGYKRKQNYRFFHFILFWLEMGSSCDFIRTPTQLYRCLHGRQTRIFQFSSTLRGGKRAIAALPLLSWAADWIFQFSSALRGAKLEFAGLPLLSSAVNWIFQLSSAQRGGILAIAALPLLSSAVKSAFQFSSALRGGKLEIAELLRVHMAKIFQSDFLSFLPFFCLLVGHESCLSSTKWRMDVCE